MKLSARSACGKREGGRRADRLRAVSARRLWPSRMRAGWLAVVGAVLVAFLSQSVVLQTHQHFGVAAISAAATGNPDAAAPQKPDRQSPADQPANCPICRELAHAGPVLPPAPIAFDAPAPISFQLAVINRPRLTIVRRAHGWQSRAPPYLQA